jgi:hypothetical protein
MDALATQQHSSLPSSATIPRVSERPCPIHHVAGTILNAVSVKNRFDQPIRSLGILELRRTDGQAFQRSLD